MTFRNESQMSHFLFKLPQLYISLDLNINMLSEKFVDENNLLDMSTSTEINTIILNFDYIYVGGYQKYNFLNKKLTEHALHPNMVNLKNVFPSKFFADKHSCMNN